MCDQPSLYYALYLLVQIFAKYDNIPLDLYGIIEAEIRKLYYNKEKKQCIEELDAHISDTMASYKEEKIWYGSIAADRPGSKNLPYIMPIRLAFNKNKRLSQLHRIEDIIVDGTYYINGIKICPYHGEGYGFDIESKQYYVSLIDDDGHYYDNGYYYHDGYYYVYDYLDHNLLKKIIRRQMDLEECKIKKN
tara:strand:+ start:3670 stop:4242 length:573 start_codon:yes stop_codon:yes gene_type:complete